ncbi:hypothetical protein FB451DRAFT_1038554, partial [Mycena latifolia]
YMGEEDFRLFQKWALEVTDCVRYGYISRKRAVSWIKKYLGGRASAWYPREVAKDPSKWTLNRILKGLFNHCFPPNFRSIQREKYERFRQRVHPIREYRIELSDLRDSIGDDIPERQFVIRFWQGADSDIRIHWAKAGYDRETSTLDQLGTFAANYETAMLIANEETSRAARTDVQKAPFRNSETAEQQAEGESSTKPASGKADKSTAPKGEKKLSKAEMNEYRGAGKCFNCGSTQHIKKDCPDGDQLKPKSQKKVQANAISSRLSSACGCLKTLRVSVCFVLPSTLRRFLQSTLQK